MNPLPVSVPHDNYLIRRNITSLDVPGVAFKRGVDAFKVLDAVASRMRRPSLVLHNLWFDAGRHPLVHLFNGVSAGRSPWVCSFEDFLPRWIISSTKPRPFLAEEGLRRMARGECKALIAHSEASRQRQIHVAQRYAPETSGAIAAKTVVLLPPQVAVTDTPANYDGRGPLRLILVGHDFYRKGGLAVLRSVSDLVRAGSDLHLTLVSKMMAGDYASHSGEREQREAASLLESLGSRVTHHESLPHERVMAAYGESHVGMLPTLSDTFGYSVLEAQAHGLPCITTDVNALPEINPADAGWTIPVDHHPWKCHADIRTAESRERVLGQIETGLSSVLTRILENPASVATKGAAALSRLKRDHDPSRAAQQLRSVYDQALA